MPIAWLTWLIRAAITALAAVATYTDIRTREIPDWVTLPPLGLGLLVFAWRLHWLGVALWGAGMVAAALPTLLPWLLGGFGGGDFKMTLALGALGGPWFALASLFWSIVSGALLFAGWAALRGRRAVHDDPPPFAVALGTGALVALALTLGLAMR